MYVAQKQQEVKFQPRSCDSEFEWTWRFQIDEPCPLFTSILPEAAWLRRSPKLVFLIRFLLVGVPYHSEYLNGVTDLVAGEDLDHEELWEPNDLKIPVYNTENGNYFFLYI